MEENNQNPEVEISAKKRKTRLTKATKQRVLKYLEKTGFSRENLKRATEGEKDAEAIIEYMVKSCEEAEAKVERECDSLSLNNINQWLELMKSTQLSERCEYEAAAVVNSILLNERQPLPAKMNGIDLKAAYKFLGNALMGQPQEQMSEATKAFLSREIELLIAEANTDESDEAARDMGQRQYNCTEYDYQAQPHKCSLDPLFQDEWKT
ncbi:uncharacterized protein LOC117894021 [Drosophila subobscura]|uniref:uncharacterized protein LOC117894021 n=1 Tax=Drosophila subobscura TaxID=7241 RepID=UPI00155AA855|nr:uncharacterized protein LOC117894021 [Drosophila subobscura]